MGEGTNQIRAEIAETRERIAETAGAIGYKADVPERVKDSVSDTATAVKERVADVAGGVGSTAKRLVEDGTARVEETARTQPVAAFLGGAAVGLMVGMLVPGSRMERERLGPTAERLKDKAAEAGQEALDRGVQLADQVGERAREAVAETVPQQPAPPADEDLGRSIWAQGTEASSGLGE